MPIAPQEIQDDGRLQEFDYTLQDQPKKEDIQISEDVYTEDFGRVQMTADAPSEEDIVLADDIQLEEFDFSERPQQQ